VGLLKSSSFYWRRDSLRVRVRFVLRGHNPSHQCLAEHCKLSVMIQISLDDLTVFIYSSYSMP